MLFMRHVLFECVRRNSILFVLAGWLSANFSARAAVLTVTSTADSGPGTLRAEIAAANTAGGTNTVTVPAQSARPVQAGSSDVDTAKSGASWYEYSTLANPG